MLMMIGLISPAVKRENFRLDQQAAARLCRHDEKSLEKLKKGLDNPAGLCYTLITVREELTERKGGLQNV